MPASGLLRVTHNASRPARGATRRITLKYRINGALFRRHYAVTARGVLAAQTRAAVLINNGVAVVMRGMPRRLSIPISPNPL